MALRQPLQSLTMSTAPHNIMQLTTHRGCKYAEDNLLANHRHQLLTQVLKVSCVQELCCKYSAECLKDIVFKVLWDHVEQAYCFMIVRLPRLPMEICSCSSKYRKSLKPFMGSGKDSRIFPSLSCSTLSSSKYKQVQQLQLKRHCVAGTYQHSFHC